MNLESIPGSGGRTAPATARIGYPDPEAKRPGGGEGNGGEVAAAATPVAPPDAQDGATRADAQRLVGELNKQSGKLNEKLGFEVHEATGQIMVRIVDRNTGKVIRECPPRQFLDLEARLKEMVGLFLDEQG
jgi:uncharacterized FlaG/YvyC family protein